MGNNLTNHLNNYKEEEMKLPDFNNDWFIFGRNTPLALASIDRAKEVAIKKGGVKRIRIHDFRHSHASNLIAFGANIVAVSRRLGHSDVSMTLKVYTHLINNANQQLIDTLNKSISIKK